MFRTLTSGFRIRIGLGAILDPEPTIYLGINPDPVPNLSYLNQWVSDPHWSRCDSGSRTPTIYLGINPDPAPGFSIALEVKILRFSFLFFQLF
jgi:hypothetical protein